ncbi:hypothetical protein C8250_028910 [Streptomyces sp. So13.3]|nr:hypothetical protein C8250_028910 [Streptomyces sp. So13.3]
MHKVYLGVLEPTPPADAHGDYNHHLAPNVVAATFAPTMFEAKSSQLVTLKWPSGSINCWARDRNGVEYRQLGIDSNQVRAIVRVYDGFRAAEIKLEASVGEEPHLDPA